MNWSDRDLTVFKRSISEVALKAHPEGWLVDFLTETDVNVIIESGARRGRARASTWFDVADLDNLPWAGQIIRAALLCDHFEQSSPLYALARIQELTIIVRGEAFDENDVLGFQRAILNLPTLKYVKVIVDPEALEFVKTYLAWPGEKFRYDLEAAGTAMRLRK